MSGRRHEDWKRVREVFEAALKLPAAERQALVATLAGHEPSVRDEVLGLLASHDDAADFLETPAASLLDDEPTADLTGRRIGPYVVESRIGGGGMGEVYRAQDSRLGRAVAIKVLPPHAATDRPARERFEREARAVAALNHPNICTLYDIGTHDDVDYIVMEFLDGETLATRLDRGPIAVADALRIAIEVASALDRAHKHGIVHRDLKPRNVMLTRGEAKLLDFGLAKTAAPAVVMGDGKAASAELTVPGTILGTLHYMSPEQLEGRTADVRSDLFAFGCVLYEMVTGRKAFDARSSASLLTAIMAQAPTPVRVLQPAVPAGVEYVIDRCLAKDPDDRWQTARDLLAELKRVASRTDAGTPAPRSSRPVRTALLTAGALVLGSVLAWTWLTSKPVTPAAAPVAWLSILPPPNGFDLAPSPVVSPDGRYVVFKAEDASHTSLLWVKDLAGPGVRPIAGTDGIVATEPPFWSPDSRSIGFFAHGQLKRVDVGGGAPQTLAVVAEPRGGTWTTGGVIVFDKGDRLLYRIAASGGAATLVPGSAPGQVRLFPHALPDGRHYLFTSRNVNGLGEGIYVASLDSPDVRRVSDAWSVAAYASGHLLFGKQGALFAQPFDVTRLVTTGEPRRVADGLGIGCCTPLSFAFSASASVIALWSGSSQPPTQLQWVTRDGSRRATVGDAGIHPGFALSPDGRRAALERQDLVANNYDVWLLDLAGGGPAARLTLDGRATLPVWSPDGTRVLVMYRARGLVALPTRGGEGITILEGPASKWPSDWSPDGRYVAFYDASQGFRLQTARTDVRGGPTVYREGTADLEMLRFFPRGGWVAYVSEETGQFEVYIDSFPAPGQKTRVSTRGGLWPMWRRDGKELYYIASDRSLVAVPIETTPDGLRTRPPVRLFEAPPVSVDRSRMQYAPAVDGSRFLFNARVEDKTPAGLTVISNWTALLAAPPR